MKKLLSVILAACVAVFLSACLRNDGGNSANSNWKNSEYRVAMISDYGDITDQSFNQTTYEACKAFCEKYDIPYTYKKPLTDNTAERIASTEGAIDEGYNIIVLPGFSFSTTVVEMSQKYPEIKFIGLDLAEGDILEAGVPQKGETYDYNPANWNVKNYYNPDNTYLAIYKDELGGYMAGYAAVKLGYTRLGYIGGMAVPACLRFGYGYIQGAETAAKELGITVSLKYGYANSFVGDAEITAAMDTWYGSGTEIVFACGGGIFTSVGEAAAKVNAKVIGVDVDQKNIIDGLYGDGITVTSAVKGLYPSTYNALDDIINHGKWDEYKGQIKSLGLINGEEPEANYVFLPTASTQFNDRFTEEDYKALVKALYDGTIKVSDNIDKEPVTANVKVEWLGNIK